MHAYLFTGVATLTQLRRSSGQYGERDVFQSWDACESMIVFGESMEEAQGKFEKWMRRQEESEKPARTDIKRISAAQFANELFMESGPAALDWLEICRQAQAQMESTPIDDFEQGYWLDTEQAVPPEPLSAEIDELQRDLPEDISSGLNWSPDKQFLFILSLLKPPPPLPDFVNGVETNDPEASSEELNENGDDSEAAELNELLANYPQVVDKEAAALVRARNSAVAAWLWRRYAANKQLSALPIRIDPWCGVLELPA